MEKIISVNTITAEWSIENALYQLIDVLQDAIETNTSHKLQRLLVCVYQLGNDDMSNGVLGSPSGVSSSPSAYLDAGKEIDL